MKKEFPAIYLTIALFFKKNNFAIILSLWGDSLDISSKKVREKIKIFNKIKKGEGVFYWEAKKLESFLFEYFYSQRNKKFLGMSKYDWANINIKYRRAIIKKIKKENFLRGELQWQKFKKYATKKWGVIWHPDELRNLKLQG